MKEKNKMNNEYIMNIDGFVITVRDSKGNLVAYSEAKGDFETSLEEFTADFFEEENEEEL